MKRLFPFVLIILGIIIIFTGFVYDAVFAGIPYQAPILAIAASYNFQSQIASIIRWSGLGICVIGGAIIIIPWLLRKDHVQKKPE